MGHLAACTYAFAGMLLALVCGHAGSYPGAESAWIGVDIPCAAQIFGGRRQIEDDIGRGIGGNGAIADIPVLRDSAGITARYSIHQEIHGVHHIYHGLHAA